MHPPVQFREPFCLLARLSGMTLIRTAKRIYKRGLVRARRLPAGMRFVVGLVLIIGGVFGFLPILGFWMIPLGISVASLDVVALWRWLSGRGRPGKSGTGQDPPQPPPRDR